MLGSCPIATKSPSRRNAPSSRPCSRRGRGPRVTLPSSPSTSSTTAFVTHSILGFARARSSMIGEARNSSRRWTTVHLVRELREEDRLLHRRVAAADDDDVLAAEEGGVADGAVRDAAPLERALGLEPELARARAGGDDHRAGAVLVAPTSTRNGRSEKSTAVTSSVMNSAPKRSAWRRKSCIIAGPRTPSG